MAAPEIDRATTTLDAAPLAADLPARLAAAAPRVVVLGDAVLDQWLTGPSKRLSREAPVPVVEVDHTRGSPGAAANTAANLAALGARTELVSVLGDDADAATVRELLATYGVGTDGVVTDPTRPTAAKRRVLADDALVARFDTTTRGRLGDAARDAVHAAFRRAVEGADAVVVCDYDGGSLDGVVDLLGPPGERSYRLVVDAHDPARWTPARPDVVTPNAGEAATLLGRDLGGPDRVAAAEAAGAELRERSGAGAVVVTLDRDGALLLPSDGDAPAHRTFARPSPEANTCGAGDTFTAALVLALAAGTPAATAVELAQAAADVVVGRPGTSVCGTGELAERVAAAEGPLLDATSLAAIVDEQRVAGRRVVFTNGCFDVVHRGHIASLNQAKRLGDVLIVALNSDASVARLKGPSRPVNPLADRAAVIGALSCVDHVTVFDDDTPAELLELLEPDVYAKGGDYTPQMLRESATVGAYGGRVVILDYLPDRSTSAIVERIRGDLP
ncbi:rfaE bifunctional protein kinase chain/domain/rfaE bifunctional protein nucleotidyltransferase chain/domain [Actinomycetospora succinea]|uniref:Bifunctional protein HldE n=1 Tax=Actinomycetospora succinea TaxID=663603 RepID=A0A4V6PWP2_9PSEU|nr:D-glycero-beta-D-manno-heptose 1-phosphate adenylyltransferase [Actinomycetospora succinea]TDQ46427.1 rfaE bifunctional protein kinase chain/domain/rfaE bifunctional protein nucleotidyltransferase chain/domain [Actinomycetospora succinea]